MLKGRVQKLESLSRQRGRRKHFIVYENDWRTDRPDPTPEELADPNAEILRVVFVHDWRNHENR